MSALNIVAVIECGKVDLQEVCNSQATFLVFSCPVSRGKEVLVGQGGRLMYPITPTATFYGSSDDLYGTTDHDLKDPMGSKGMFICPKRSRGSSGGQ